MQSAYTNNRHTGLKGLILVKYQDIYKQNQDSVNDYKKKYYCKIFQLMDEKEIDLLTLTADQCAIIAMEAFNLRSKNIYSRALRYFLSALKFIYQVTNTDMPNDIKNINLKTLSSLISERNNDTKFPFFKDVQGAIENIDKVKSKLFVEEMKVICVLAWNGMSAPEMTNIKMSDVNFDKMCIENTKMGTIYLSPYEMKIIKNYTTIDHFITYNQGKIFTFVPSKYLFKYYVYKGYKGDKGNKISIRGFNDRIKKVNEALSESHLPTVSLRLLTVNGSFYKVYTNNLSKFTFDENRRLQYEEYVKLYWKNKED